jgi:hypothetical protein
MKSVKCAKNEAGSDAGLLFWIELMSAVLGLQVCGSLSFLH